MCKLLVMCSRMQLLLLATSSIHPSSCCSDVLRGSTLSRFQFRPHPQKINGLKSGERGVQVVAPPLTTNLVPVRYLAHNTCHKTEEDRKFLE